MESEAKLNYLRISPRKVRLVADLIRGKKAREAAAILVFTTKKAAKPMKKLLDSAIANAKNNFQAEEDTLYISKITVDEAPKLKRWRARSRGRSMQIQKKASHIAIVLSGQKTKTEKKENKSPQEPLKKEGSSKTRQTKSKPDIQKSGKQPQPKTAKNPKKIFRRKSF